MPGFSTAELGLDQGLSSHHVPVLTVILQKNADFASLPHLRSVQTTSENDKSSVIFQRRLHEMSIFVCTAAPVRKGNAGRNRSFTTPSIPRVQAQAEDQALAYAETVRSAPSG